MNGKSRFTAVLADDHELARLGLRAVLAAGTGVEVVGEAGTVAQAIAEAERTRPGVLVTELALPDGSGLDACREIRTRAPETRVVVLTEQVGDEAVLAAVRAGVAGYLSKRVPAQDLARAIHAVACGETRLDAASMAGLMDRIRRGATGAAVRDILALTAQERRVLALVAQGKTNKEIGSSLGLSEKTVKNYLSRAFEKLNVTRRAHAAVLFVRDAALHGAARRPGPPELLARTA
jgi:DNA-binding NarL/FixJ family response regulator